MSIDVTFACIQLIDMAIKTNNKKQPINQKPL